MERRRERVGLIFAALCALNGAVVPAVAKLTTGHTDALTVSAASTVIAGLAAVVVLSLRRQLSELARSPQAPALVVVAALGTVAATSFMYLGASRASAIETVLCLQIEPAYSLFIAWGFLGHRPTRRRLVATAVLLSGIACAVGAPGTGVSPGIGWLLAAPLCWQASHLVVLRKLRGVDPSLLAAARYIHGGWQLLLLWLVFGDRGGMAAFTAGGSFLPAIVLQGVVLSYGGTLVWYQALTRLDLARTTAIVVPSVPLLSLVASFLILGEVPSLLQWVGMLLTAVGVLVFVRDSGTRQTVEI